MRLRRRAGAARGPASLRATAANIVPDDVGEVVLATQWPCGASRPTTGWAAPAMRVLGEACLDADVLRRRGPVIARNRRTARDYLLELNGETEPLPVACELVGLDVAKVRGAVRLRLP